MRLGKILAPLARRFVAGETALDAIEATRRVNARGIKAILDFLGEDVRSAETAAAAAEEYVRLLKLIGERRVDACISLKVSQMGLLISRDLCAQNLARVLKAAEELGNFVWLDMEGSALTQRTINLFEDLRTGYKNIGLCLQAYLVRTGGDLDQLMRKPFTVRLCKGAYKEPPQIAFAAKTAVDGNFRMLIQKVLDHVGAAVRHSAGGPASSVAGVYPAFATHDSRLIDHIVSLAQGKRIAPSLFEFQMLYGIRNALLESLAGQGYRVAAYIPYGTHWFPYFLRRLRERRENVYFLMRNLFQ